MDGIAAVQARISEIQSRFPSPPVAVGTAATAGGGSFADALAAANGTNTPVTGTATQEQFARDVLKGLGAPITDENMKAVVAWQKAEGTKAANNPLATTQGWDGSSSFNSVGVKNYTSYSDGVAATLKTLQNGHYGAILAALAQGNSAQAVGQAVAASPWGTGDGVLRVLKNG